MKKLTYVTSNRDKVRVANRYLIPLGIEVVGESMELVEFQTDSIEEITKDKARQAFEALKKPLLVNDASWNFVALNGFPSAYMKYVNQWLSPNDFISLMKNHEDKTVIYREVMYYIDEKQTKAFSEEIKGTFLGEEKGKGLPSWTLISLRSDKKSIAQCWEDGIEPVDEYPIWRDFSNWFNKQNSE